MEDDDRYGGYEVIGMGCSGGGGGRGRMAVGLAFQWSTRLRVVEYTAGDTELAGYQPRSGRNDNSKVMISGHGRG